MTSDNGSGSELPSLSGETVPDQTFLPEMGLVLQIFLMLCLIAVTIVVKPASLKGVLTKERLAIDYFHFKIRVYFGVICIFKRK